MRLSPTHTSRALTLLVAAAVGLGTAGCSKPVGSLSGKVTYKGKEVKGGNVIFLKADGQTVWAPIKEDGTYSVDKIPAGPVKVGVETSSLKPKNAPGQAPRRSNPAPADAQNQPKQMDDPVELAKRYVAIPDKYEDPKTSGKEYTVTPGKQTFDIPLD
jgi:hypothetical protein